MNETAPLTDNPCWGGPDLQHHNLEHLLKVLSDSNTSQSEYKSYIKRIHKKLVVFHDENYLVINKPADLRMDGDYPATVHKLLLYLFPPSSLKACESDDTLKSLNDGIGSGSKLTTVASFENHTTLLHKIAPLSKHSCLKDDPFRIVHQLDYATSGVLLFAKNKKAAGTACKSFQERQTDKQYAAVVINPDGDSNEAPFSSDFLQSLPELPPSCLSQWSDGSLETRYRKKRRRETDDRVAKKNTFDGFMPVHSVFAKWRGTLLRLKKEKEGDPDELQNKSRKKKPNEDFPPLPKVPMTADEIDEVLSYGQSWKAIKSSKQQHSRCWVTVVEDMAKEYNASLSKFYAGLEESEVNGSNDTAASEVKKVDNASLPPMFRVQDEVDDLGSFYICAAIGEIDGRFEVSVDPSAAKAATAAATSSLGLDTKQLPEMRPSLTKCTVLWRGFMQFDVGCDASIPVTKVLLTPWTGRRHQLRVHLAHVAGCPILGDVAYGGNVKVTCKSKSANETVASNTDARVACPRMCLHAKQLTIPLIEGKRQTFEAPDPFILEKKHEQEERTIKVL